MKKTNTIGNILFWLTLLSPMISFSLSSYIGEADFFGVAGIIRYTWIMLLFIPLGILSILIGHKLKNSKLKYKKNYVIAFICLPLLIVFGSYRLIFRDIISYDTNKMTIIEHTINLELPNQVKIATTKFDSYNESYAKIIDQNEMESFENEIESNSLWQIELKPEIGCILPTYVQEKIKSEPTSFDYFIFYNCTYREYNAYTSNVNSEYIFIAYDKDMQKLLILDSLKINNNNGNY